MTLLACGSVQSCMFVGCSMPSLSLLHESIVEVGPQLGGVPTTYEPLLSLPRNPSCAASS